MTCYISAEEVIYKNPTDIPWHIEHGLQTLSMRSILLSFYRSKLPNSRML